MEIIHVKKNHIAKYTKNSTKEVFVLSPGFYTIRGDIKEYSMEPIRNDFSNIRIRNRFGQDLIFDVTVVSTIAGGTSHRDYYGSRYCESQLEGKNLSNHEIMDWWERNHPLLTYLKYEKKFELDEKESNSPINNGQTHLILEDSFNSFDEYDFEDFESILSVDMAAKDAYIETRNSLFEKGRQLIELKINSVSIYQNKEWLTKNLDVDIKDNEFNQENKEKDKIYTLGTRKGNNMVIKINKNAQKDNNKLVFDYDLLDEDTPIDKRVVIENNTAELKSRMSNISNNTSNRVDEEEVIDENGYASIETKEATSEEIIRENEKELYESMTALKDQEDVAPTEMNEITSTEEEIIARLANEYNLSIDELFKQLDDIKELNNEGLNIAELKSQIAKKNVEIADLQQRLQKKMNLVKKNNAMAIKGINEISDEYEKEIIALTEKYNEKIEELNDIISDLEKKLNKKENKELRKSRFVAIPVNLLRKIKGEKEISGVNTALLNKFPDEELVEETNNPENVISVINNSVNDEIAELKRQLAEKEKVINNLEESIAEKDNKIKELEENIIDKDVTITDKDREIGHLNMLNEELTKNVKDYESLKANNDFLNREIASSKDNLDKKDEEILGLEKELSDKYNEIALLKTDKENLEKDVQRYKEENTISNDLYDEKIDKIYELENDLSNKDKEIDTLKEENDRLIDKNTDLVSDNQDLAKENKELNNRNEELVKENETLKAASAIDNLKISELDVERIVLVEANGILKKYKIDIKGRLNYNGKFAETLMIDKLVYNEVKNKMKANSINDFIILNYDCLGNKMNLTKTQNELVTSKSNHI